MSLIIHLTLTSQCLPLFSSNICSNWKTSLDPHEVQPASELLSHHLSVSILKSSFPMRSYTASSKASWDMEEDKPICLLRRSFCRDQRRRQSQTPSLSTCTSDTFRKFKVTFSRRAHGFVSTLKNKIKILWSGVEDLKTVFDSCTCSSVSLSSPKG